MRDDRVVVIGGGPAGLTAAYELAKRGRPSVVIEREDRVGGLARTEDHRGYRFDLGGHRFFTKSAAVMAFWREVLGAEFLVRPRLSRIYFDRRFFYYPLRPFDALRKMGLWESCLVVASYLKWQIFPHRREDTFEEWVTNRFGARLFEKFFRVYTEKVWGISCRELKAEWAAQRIKDLSLRTVALDMLPWRKKRKKVKSLIEEFHYPRHGPGMLWEAVSERIVAAGGEVHTGFEVESIGERTDGSFLVSARRGNESIAVEADRLISTMPLPVFLARLQPRPPPDVLESAARLAHRDFLTVCLIVDQPELFPDNWIYIHDPEVRVGRIQNFKNWSPDMVPDPSKTSLGLEYFCTRGDDLWSMTDEDLIALGQSEIERIGLARAADVEDGKVIRVLDAYPIYDAAYAEHLAICRRWIEGIPGLQTIGRNGLHRYNNQDHAMLTGMYAAENLVGGAHRDVWSVNADDEYHEQSSTEDVVTS